MELLLDIFGVKFKAKLFHIGQLRLYTIFSTGINNFNIIKLSSLANKVLILNIFNKNIITKWLIKKEG